MKNILVATDLSTRSDRAVQRAVRLSAKLGLPCHVLSVIDDDLPADMRATLLKDVEARLAQFVKSVAAPGQIMTSAAVAGDPQEVLLGLAVVALVTMRKRNFTVRPARLSSAA